jgi:HEAT repeat protein
MTRDGHTADAEALFKKLADSKYAAEIRVAALGGLIDTSSNPSRLIIEMVQSDDDVMQSAALAALTPNSDKKRRDQVAELLADAKPEAQLRLLAVLGDQADVNLRPTLLKLVSAKAEAATPPAAVESMITHGTADDVWLLLGMGASNHPWAPAARKTLQQMGADGVDEALIKFAGGADRDRALIIRTLAARNSKAAVPMLLKIVTGGDAALKGEASTALGVVGTVEHLPPLTDIIVTADDTNARNAAEGAIKAICARTPDKESCANVILPALKKANSPAAKVGLLRTLSRMPIDKSLNEVRAGIDDNDQRVADAAVRELADWPNIAAAPPLLQIAKNSQNQTHAVLALRGYIRLAGTKDHPAAERVHMYRQALAAAQRVEEKKQALAGLGDVPSIEALEILQEKSKDADLTDDAASATIRLAKQLGTSHNARMLAMLREMRSQPGRDALRGQIDEGIKTLEQIAERTQGFIVAWMVAGPYTQAGKNGSALFDVAFAPEKDSKTDWRPLIRPADSADLWMINFAKVLGAGNERVAYLKTNINSPREQQAILELGSDDGVKAWLNGKQVHANNAARAVKQGEDKVKISLKPGSNVLLLKITQGGGDWAACARLRAADGSRLTDVQVSPE